MAPRPPARHNATRLTAKIPAHLPALAVVAAGLLLGACSQVTPDGSLAANLGLTPSEPAKEPAAANPRADLEKATAYWSKEFANNPRNIDAAVNYAKNLKALGEKDKAIAVLQQASMYNSDHRGLASEYGRLALDADQAQLAEKLLARAEDPLKPDWKLISAQGTAVAKQGRHREAVPLFERASTLSPDNPTILNNLGMALAMNGEAAKAEGVLRKASELPGASPRVRQNLALVLGLQGKFDDAKQIAGADMTPEKAAANVAYLRKMVDAAPPARDEPGTGGVIAPARKVASAKGGKAAPGLKGSETAGAVAGTGWSTEVARAEQPLELAAPKR